MTTPLLRNAILTVECTSSTEMYDITNLVCLVVDCSVTTRPFLVVPATHSVVQRAIELDWYAGTWKFRIDPELNVEEFWSQHSSYDPLQLASIFPNTEYEETAKVRVGYDLKDHSIQIGKGLTYRAIHDLLSSSILHQGDEYIVFGVYDKTNLDHLSQLANDVVAESD